MNYPTIEDAIGRTPQVALQRLNHAENAARGNVVLAKLEGNNPAGSVKDRPALSMIRRAEERGEIKPGDTLIEATSGNTGIALAMVCAARGYPFVAFMSDSFSVERRKLMRALGEKVVLVPAAERATGMLKRAEEFAAERGALLARQFENPANPAFHRNTTGPEILQDFAGKRLDWYVTGWGTGGTLTGVGQMIRLARPETKIVATEPAGASMLGGKDWAPHKIQGWTPNLIPAVLDRDVYHHNLPVTDEVARDTARALATKEGIFCGISSGGTFAAALQVARDHAKPGDVILAMLPDTGERYLSTFLFEGINEGTDEV
jgi:cysteine synthase A